MNRTLKVALAASVAILPAGTAVAFPERPLTMVIGFAAGGSTDIQGRVLANVMEEFLGQPVNVVNRPGAGSAVAYTQLANTDDGGHTFLFGGLTALTFTPIITEVEYSIDDFRYVAGLAEGQNAIVASPNMPFQTWEELIAHGQSNPMTYAQQTPLDQMIIETVAEIEGLDLSIVPTGGGGGMAPLVLGGEVDFAYSGGTHAQYTPSGEMNILAFLSAERSPFYPEVPTLMELGYDLSMEDYRTIVVPANVSDEVVQILQDAAEYASQNADFISVTEDNTNFPAVFLTHEEMEENVRRIRAATEELMAGADLDALSAD